MVDLIKVMFVAESLASSTRSINQLINLLRNYLLYCEHYTVSYCLTFFKSSVCVSVK